MSWYSLLVDLMFVPVDVQLVHNLGEAESRTALGYESEGCFRFEAGDFLHDVDQLGHRLVGNKSQAPDQGDGVEPVRFIWQAWLTLCPGVLSTTLIRMERIWKAGLEDVRPG